MATPNKRLHGYIAGVIQRSRTRIARRDNAGNARDPDEGNS